MSRTFLLQFIPLVSVVALVFAIAGCGNSGEYGGKKIEQLPIRPFNLVSFGAMPIPLFDTDGKLAVIVGKAATKREWITDLCGFSPDGEKRWTAPSKFCELKTFYKVGDLDGDGLDDVVGHYLRKAYLFSGEDGELIAECSDFPLGQVAPHDILDVDHDGTPDLRFVRKSKGNYRVSTYSGRNLRLIEDQKFTRPTAHSFLIRESVPDETGDRFREILVVDIEPSEKSVKVKVSVLDGKTFKTIRSIPKPSSFRISQTGNTRCLSDLNRDDIPELLVYNTTGAKNSKWGSFMAVYDGKTGQEIWHLDGEELGGPLLEVTTVEKKSKKRETSRDVRNQFGKFAALVPDQNQDNISEIAVAGQFDAENLGRSSVLVLSGADGSIVKKRNLDGVVIESVHLVNLSHPQDLLKTTTERKLKLGITGYRKNKPIGLLVIEL